MPIRAKSLPALATLLVMLLASLPRPARAASDQLTQPLIIGGVVVGVVTVIAIIAIIGTSVQEANQLTPARLPRERDLGSGRRLQLGPQCGAGEGPPPLLCW
ncbi:MAG: hypothetical protein HY699_03040 [Deltaproteobacteria bacterium]|nr:hypothetical protein [Deltaproteobacteria bacterium]